MSTVYTKMGGLLPQQNGEIAYARARKEESSRQHRQDLKECDGTTIRVPGFCDVRIEITRTLEKLPLQSQLFI